MDEKENKIKDNIADILNKKNITLVELQVRSFGRKNELKILVDKAGGITLDECARLNRELGDVIEANNFFMNTYVLEVSSPGLDRTLKNEKDFLWARGKLVKVITRKPIGKKQEFTGVIKAVEKDKVELGMEDDTVISLGWEDILKAKLEIR